MRGIAADHEFADPEWLYDIISSLLSSTYMKGLSFGLALSQLLAESPRFQFASFANTVNLMLFPTIFHSNEWLYCIDDDLLLYDSKYRQSILQKYVALTKKETGPNTQRNSKVLLSISESKHALPMISLEL